MENTPPPGFILVDENEYNQLKENLKSIEKAVNSSKQFDINTDINRIVRDIASKANNRGSKSAPKEDLSSLIEAKCRDAQKTTLRSKLETTKSSWTQQLKKAVVDQESKLKKSKASIKQKLDEGQVELKDAYSTALTEAFQNPDESSRQIKQFACDKLVQSYRDTMQNYLFPEIDNMYKEHCNKVDNALKEWIAEYTANQSRPGSQSAPSTAIHNKIAEIQKKLAQLQPSRWEQADNSIIRSLEDTLEKVKGPIDSFNVSVVTREPTEEDPIEAINRAIDAKHYNEALHQALLLMNVDVLLKTCRQIPVDELFSDPIPDDQVLLSFLNQLKLDIDVETELKVPFLQGTIRAIRPESPTVQLHCDQVRSELLHLLENIEISERVVDSSLARRLLKDLKWDASCLFRLIPE